MNRDYGGLDADALLESSSVMRTNTDKNLAAFSAFDLSLDGAFITLWKNTHNAAQVFMDDETYVDDIQIHSTHTDKQLNVCIGFVRDIKYYAGRAWGTGGGKYRAFRFAKVHAMANTPYKFLTYCKTNHRLATDYVADLNAVSMPAGLLGNFLTAITDYDTALTAQEVFTQKRLVATEDRTILYNTIYDFMRRVNGAAANVFVNDVERRKLFDLPQAEKKGKEEEV